MNPQVSHIHVPLSVLGMLVVQDLFLPVDGVSSEMWHFGFEILM